jgi:hypothetical protein
MKNLSLIRFAPFHIRRPRIRLDDNPEAADNNFGANLLLLDINGLGSRLGHSLLPIQSTQLSCAWNKVVECDLPFCISFDPAKFCYVGVQLDVRTKLVLVCDLLQVLLEFFSAGIQECRGVIWREGK